MTAREYIDEIKLRHNRLGVSIELNDAKILNYINKARRDVQIATMAVIPERYGARTTFTLNNTSAPIDADSMQHLYYATVPIQVRRFQLPVNVLEVMSLWITHVINGVPTYREARRTNKQELHNIKTHCFNMPTIDRPLYVLEAKQQDSFGSFDNICYIAGFETNGQNIFNQGNVMIELWSIIAIDDFDLRSEIEPVFSVDLEEFAVRQAMIYCLNNIKYMSLKQSMQIDTDKYKDTLLQNYTMFRDKPIHQLPSHEGI